MKEVREDRREEETDKTQPSFFVVGIGASAGGLEALERFFERVPPQSGMAYVVVQHLSPDFKSLMDELLARKTTIPIFRVENGMEVRPDAIFLIPPRKDMILANGKLLLTDKDSTQAMPIDHFFRSLAQDAAEQAIGIVLSGTGSDGSRGIRDIHEVGGLVIVQSLNTAKFDGMPKSSLQTGVADYVLAPEDMPQALIDYIQHPLLKHASVKDPEQSGMDGVFQLLREAYGTDFSLYTPNTVARRTERRLLLNRTPGLVEYLQLLRNDPDELSALYRDLLIGVTHFFRDKDAFDRLEQDVLPSLLERASPDDEFRAWVAGCATGEEAYSLAILIDECASRLKRSPNIKIFATDVHPSSLEFAGTGIYKRESLSDVSPDRLRRYFLAKGEDYQVCPELRKLVVFAQHNLIRDAPFTKLDLVSCRNLLIYFQSHAQKKILSLFHFGLKTGGVLFLGPSESPAELSDEFEVIDHRWKVYRKRRDLRLPGEMRLAVPTPPKRPRATLTYRASSSGGEGILSVYDAVMDRYMPPSLLVTENRQLVHAFAGAGKYLQVRDGRQSGDILDLVDAELRMALTGALSRALAEKSSVTYKGLRIGTADGDRMINVTVDLIPSSGVEPNYLLVRLEEMETTPPPLNAQEMDLRDTSRSHVLSLETELRYTKENLQSTVEELETSNEELQATNEELVASNEELQSTNEELHSVNEELYTVNAEYQKKIAELTELTTDMENLLVSADIHTIFLDDKLCIRKFTPRIAEVFHLMPQDLGRRVDNFTHNLNYPRLNEDIAYVLGTGLALERQVQDRHENWFLLRLLPYRSGELVQGVVLTLIDINAMKLAEASMERMDQQLSAILRHSPHTVFVRNREGRYVLTDDAFKALARTDPMGKTSAEVFTPEEAAALTQGDDLVLEKGETVESELILGKAEGAHTFLCVKFPLRDEQGWITGVGGINTDVTRLKAAERAAREGIEQRDQFLAMLSHELRNPLAAIVNATAVIETIGTRKAESEEWFRVIERRARHMARMLDDLLDVARVTQNKIEIRRQPLDLRETINACVEETRGIFEAQGVALDIQKPEYPLPIEGDADRLQQIQVNLLTNAAKHTPRGGQVWYQLEQQEEQAVIRVRDNGTGIPSSMLERIFDVFVQGDTSIDRGRGGIGVGLTLVRALVQMHGGTVRAYSAGPGRGSEFVVRLPLSHRPSAYSTHDESPPTDGPGLHILVVEDDADIRESLQTLLAMDGHRVRAVSKADAALEDIERSAPQLMLVDIGLPDIDGYELAKQVRKRFADRRIFLIALTGYGRPSDRRAAMEAGFDKHLTKPVRPRELLDALEELRIQVAAQCGEARNNQENPA